MVFFCAISAFSQQDWKTYPFSPANSVLNFPFDDGKHTGAGVSTEWWYLNLHVIGSAPSYKQYDVMLCYFSRPLSMRIFNIADPVSGVSHSDVNQTPFVFSQEEGHWKLDYNIPIDMIADHSEWTYPADSNVYSYSFYAVEPVKNDELNIVVSSNRPPLIVGGDGFIPIGNDGDSSFYYSYTNMSVKGTIKFNGEVDTITSGIAWIDRQWGPFIVGLNNNNMYEWFSLQVDKPGTTWGMPQTPSEFNIWQVFSDSNSVPAEPQSSLVSAIYDDTDQDTCSTFIFERTGYWYDATNKVYYSQGWRFINPLKGINIDMRVPIQNQVVDVTLFNFWEGSTILKGTVNNQAVDGLGFAELVAGHHSEMKSPSIPTNFIAKPFSDHYTLNWSASTAGTFPIGGYRVYRSASDSGYWQYIGTTTGLSYDDYPPEMDSYYHYAVSCFDNQTAISASDYATPSDGSESGMLDISTQSNNIKVFPNPGSEKIIVEIISSFKNARLEILSLDGKIIQNKVLKNPKTEINIHNLTTGIYVLRITNKEEVITQKLIKR